MKVVKEHVIQMMGEVLLAKVTFSLQIKYFHLGRCVIRVPRDHLNELVACLFPFKGIKIIQVSGTIIKLQQKIISILRKELLREPNGYEHSLIKQIDYA
jgi:RNase P/RNase MRP subunit POP5